MILLYNITHQCGFATTGGSYTPIANRANHELLTQSELPHLPHPASTPQNDPSLFSSRTSATFAPPDAWPSGGAVALGPAAASSPSTRAKTG
jgi:hypothetical protein